MNQTTAVILDNDPSRREDIRMRLSNCGVMPIGFNDEWICLENIYHVRPTLAVLRPESPDMAIHFVNMAKAVRSRFPVIILSDQDEYQSLVSIDWQNDLYFTPYPADELELQQIIDSLDVSTLPTDHPVLIAVSLAFRKLVERLPMMGLSDEPVFIQGEPGVGKRLISQAIYRCSKADRAALESIHARDISSGWIRDMRRRIDRLRETNGMAFFYVIENIESLAGDLQSQLLLLMDGSGRRFASGGNNGRGKKIRFITMAEGDLERLSREGRFRKDLYHRLSVFKMAIPPLRDRKEDIPALADFFAAKYSLKERGGIIRLPDTVRNVFRHYHWPGNVAELQGIIKQAMAKETANWSAFLEEWCRGHIGNVQDRLPVSDIDLKDYVKKLLSGHHNMSLKKAKQHCTMKVESRILKVALSITHGNCKKAAVLLDISYKSMLNKAKAYHLVGGSVTSTEPLTKGEGAQSLDFNT
jgi:DNA-binding NtrC family response regulator